MITTCFCNSILNYEHHKLSMTGTDDTDLCVVMIGYVIVHRYQSKTAKGILDTILNVQPKDATAGGGETRESVVHRLADDMLNKLPQDYVPFEVTESLQKMGILQPMNIFLRQEIDCMQKVISLVRLTMVDLKLAIDGTIIMNETLRDALDCMYNGKVPCQWKKVNIALNMFLTLQ